MAANQLLETKFGDNKLLDFGDDGDFTMAYKSANDRLELCNSSGTALLKVKQTGIDTAQFAHLLTAVDEARPVAIPMTYTFTPTSTPVGGFDCHYIDMLMRSASANVGPDTRMYPFESQCLYSGSGAFGVMRPIYGMGQNTGSGSVDLIGPFRSWAKNTGTGSIGTVWGYSFEDPANTGGGSIGTVYGYYCPALTAGTTNYGFYSEAQNNRFERLAVGVTPVANIGTYLYYAPAAGASAKAAYINCRPNETSSTSKTYNGLETIVSPLGGTYTNGTFNGNFSYVATNASVAMTTARGLYGGLYLNAAGSMVNGYLLAGYIAGSTGTVTNLYGLHLPDITAGGTLNYAIYTGLGAVRFGDTVTLAEGKNYAMGTTTGSMLAATSSQKLGFWGATPVVQPTAVADATDASSVIARFNEWLARARTIGLLAAA